MKRTTLTALILAAGIGALPSSQVDAQAWAYPAFQPPRLVAREYNFGIASADGAGTTLLFQWREQTGPKTLFSFDVGIADPEGRESDIVALGGVGLAHRLGSATDEVPLDFLFTAGAYLAIGDDFFFRIPIGVSLGHRFDMDGMALTPYLHPRLSIDFCDDCGGSDIGVSFDLGANFELSRSLSIRGAIVFGGSDFFDDDAFGISIAWTPPSLAGRR